MPQFKHYSQSDDTPQIPEGWFFVELNRDKIKIVDNDGNSMMPYTRAMVKKDAMSMSLVEEGSLLVLSEATVSLENYSEATFHPVDSLMTVKSQMTGGSDTESNSNADFITEAEQVTPEVVAAKDEQVKKARKKKSADTVSGEQDVLPDEQSSNSEVETSTTDSSTSEEGPSV